MKNARAEVKQESLCSDLQSTLPINQLESASSNWESVLSPSKSMLSTEGFEPNLCLSDWNNFRAGVSINRKDWDGLVISEFLNSCDALVDEEYLAAFSSEKDVETMSNPAHLNQGHGKTVVDSLNGSDVIINLDDDFTIVSPTLSPPESSADFPLDIVNLNGVYKSNTQLEESDNCEYVTDQHNISQHEANIDLNDSVFDALQLVAEDYPPPDALGNMVDQLVPQLTESTDAIMSSGNPDDAVFWSYDFSHENFLPNCNEFVKCSPYNDYVTHSSPSNPTTASSTHQHMDNYARLDSTTSKRKKIPLRPIDFQMKCESNMMNFGFDNSNSHYVEPVTNDSHNYYSSNSILNRNSMPSQISKQDSSQSGPSTRVSAAYSTLNRNVSSEFNSRSNRQSYWSTRLSGHNQIKRRPSILRSGRNILLVSKNNSSSQLYNPPTFSVADGADSSPPLGKTVSHKKNNGRKAAVPRQNIRNYVVNDQQVMRDSEMAENFDNSSSQPIYPIITSTRSLYGSTNSFPIARTTGSDYKVNEPPLPPPTSIPLDSLEDIPNFTFGGFICRNNEPQIKERKEKVITQDMIDQRPRQAIRKYYSALKNNFNRQDRKPSQNTSQTSSSKGNNSSATSCSNHQLYSNNNTSDSSAVSNIPITQEAPSVLPPVSPPQSSKSHDSQLYSSQEFINLGRSEYKVIVIDDRDGRQEAVLVPNPPPSITQSVNDFYQSSAQPAPINTNTALINQPRCHQMLSHQQSGIKATCIKGRSSRSLLKDIKVITLPDGTVQKAESANIPHYSNIHNRQVYSNKCAKPNGAPTTTFQHSTFTTNLTQNSFVARPFATKGTKRQAPVNLLAYSADGDTVDINLLSSKRF